MTRVAVIGAGPGGLVAARWLLSQGLEPTIFEQGSTLGGQWATSEECSGVWPGMHTNSSRTMTAFSDLEHDSELAYQPNRDILDYLHRYAAKFGLTSRIRLRNRVELVSRDDKPGWLLRHAEGIDRFERVVVASGRFSAPAVPPVAGLETFSGCAGATTTFGYRDGTAYRGKRILVAGCAISALEVASEIAQLGAAHVVVTQRRQRYVVPKFVSGVPTDHLLYTRYGTLSEERLPAEDVEGQLKEIVLGAAGSPEQYGAPAPDPSVLTAGVTLSQHYLPLVAEGRISVRPWMKTVAGRRVVFADDHAEEFDGIFFGTGFNLRLPFLSEDVQKVLDLDAVHLDADRYTFHPELPGLAFVGMWDQAGGYFVPLELQARWIAYAWGGVIPAVGDREQRLAINAYRARRGASQKSRLNLVAIAFARAAGVEPRLDNWPNLRRALLFGPLAPSCFRLEGPDALPDAPERFVREAARFGAITSNDMTEREQRYLAALSDSHP
ncbi:dimethylaniline monooxygenase [Mycobacterium sp. E3298]|uniref:flavin-containing monooxygenase n=1 Tax=unclassified Mycobacterium TaxID=2642494 RepID=UPI0008017D87|nr:MULTISPECIES: FAD-dependent oxidoreductase [unclassified Mycobacterium]OBG56322.1 dimethylaniline monooxygenase [Mycobacterium sp. E188]OBG71773.1 dimethylaniline monooxygenase [Mycobacterium sp. E3298]OBH46078.1 dimethylaniline monooxygenase [Mycobacterium sp. E183]